MMICLGEYWRFSKEIKDYNGTVHSSVKCYNHSSALTIEVITLQVKGHHLDNCNQCVKSIKRSTYNGFAAKYIYLYIILSILLTRYSAKYTKHFGILNTSIKCY